MSKIVLIAVLIFASVSAHCGGTLELKGKISKVENNTAFMISDEGEIRIPVKKLSKKDNLKVNEAVASKKEITLRISPLALKR